MKTLCLLLMLATVRCIAQTDTTHSATPPAGAPKQGLAGVEHGKGSWPVDDDDDRHGDTIIFMETDRKLIRIIITPRVGIPALDSADRQLRDARRDRRAKFTSWSGIDVGINTFIAPDGRIGDGPQAGPFLLNNGRSRWVAINFMERKYEFGSHRAGLFWGLGLEFTGYHLSENVTLAYNGDSTYAVAVDQPQFTKNKLRQMGLRVPLMFEFNTKKAPLPSSPEEWRRYHEQDGFSKKGNFHFAAGVVGSWYFDTMYKQKYREGGENRKVRDKGSYNLLPYRVAARVQAGVGEFCLFAEYGLTPVFTSGAAPELRPLLIGISLVVD